MSLQVRATSGVCRLPTHSYSLTERANMLRMSSLRAGAARSTPLLLLRALSGQSDLAAGLGQHGNPQPVTVEPPPLAAWSADQINSVTLTGTVLTQPTLYHTSANQTVTNLLLGLRPRFSRSQQPHNQSVPLEAWGYTSLQVAQYVHAGMQVRVEGQLREGRWTDKKTGEERRQVKVVVERLHVIPPGSSTRSHHTAAEAAAAAAPQGEAELQPQQHATAAAATPAAAAAAAPRESKPPSLTPTIRTTYSMFQEQGMTFFEVAAARGQNISTAVDYVLKGTQFGLPLDWARAASELQLGPKGSPWLTGDEVWAAISAACQEQFPGEDPTAQLMSVGLKRVHQLLEGEGRETAAKLGAQESLAGGAWVTYGQIKLVIRMRLGGMDWNTIILDPPALLPTRGGIEAPPF